jgi:hypothetical protein
MSLKLYMTLNMNELMAINSFCLRNRFDYREFPCVYRAEMFNCTLLDFLLDASLP